MRVSLTADPVEEVKVAWEILRVLGLRHKGPVLIACPSCGRTNVDVLELTERVSERLEGYEEVFEVAVMGCAVNGPGEAGDADFGIAGGRDAGFIYAHGEVLRKVTQTDLVDELFDEIDAWIAGGMVRPERKTRKLNLPVVQRPVSRPSRRRDGCRTRRSARACRDTPRAPRSRTGSSRPRSARRP